MRLAGCGPPLKVAGLRPVGIRHVLGRKQKAYCLVGGRRSNGAAEFPGAPVIDLRSEACLCDRASPH